MISMLRGRVARRTTGAVVVDTGGVGYLVHVAGHELLPPVGKDVELHTSLQVREDSMTLFGFTHAEALEMFELLLGASGVGPKLALAALGTHRPAALRAAISTEDLASLTMVPGVGKKVAQRIILELRDKVGVLVLDDDLGPVSETVADDPRSEVRAALAQLGYQPAEITTAVRGLPDDGDVSTLLRLALRSLSSGAVR